MKRLGLTLFILTVLAVSCTDNNKPATQVINEISIDTIIKKEVIQEEGGKIRHAVYFLVRKTDTSNLRYDISINPDDSIEIIVYEKGILRGSLLSYREELQEQSHILREASMDFDLNSLKKIWDISLSSTGDLAIAITKQLPPEYFGKSLHNLDVGKFLLTSKLTKDLNELLKPYGKKIKRYVVEKAQFLDSSIIFKYNNIETPKSEIPTKILDAQIWPAIESNGS